MRNSPHCVQSSISVLDTIDNFEHVSFASSLRLFEGNFHFGSSICRVGDHRYPVQWIFGNLLFDFTLF